MLIAARCHMKKTVRHLAEKYFFEGNRLMAGGDDFHAEESFRLAIQTFPEFAEAYANLGLLLQGRGDTRAAESCYHRSISLNPNYPETHLNLGSLYAHHKQFKQAEYAYKRALSISPDSTAAWSNLGALYASMKREVAAEQCHRTAIALDGSYAYAKFNLSYLLLRQGRFEEGWHCLESRNWYAALAAQFECPRWQGESLIGKSILVCLEAGLGDVIQFCRYTAELKARRAAHATLICHPPLKMLLASLLSVDSIISADEVIPKAMWDYWTPLLSIPYHVKTRMESIPANVPYLHVPNDRVERWVTLLPEHKMRVGLVWRGNPLFENDADRSLPSLLTLKKLWSVDEAKFFSLQKGEGEHEAAQPPEGLVLQNIGPLLKDFSDTAAIIMNLDLVISVDTAVAHLAGALGKPCWVLLPDYKTDWRWLKERTDSPWYPSVKLFRQTTAGDWESVISEVCDSLRVFIKNSEHPQ